MGDHKSRRGKVWRVVLAGLVLVIATILTYQPVWHAGYIWDDDVYVTENKLLGAPDGLRRIWFSQESPSQYFPLTYTTFRAEYGLWGLNPSGYHWVNILLHAANALLVWRVLSRLGVPAAWLAAGLFALHPVQVETVAWITERKNVLSLLFYLLAVWAWIEFVSCEQKNAARDTGSSCEENILNSRRLRPAHYILVIICFLLALFSKTTACTLPAALLLVLWLKKVPIDRWRWLQIAPFFVIGLAMGLVTIWWERHHIGTSGGVFTINWLDRLLIASRGVWFYAQKLFWPANLTFSYPRWVISATDPLAYGWLLLGLLLCAAIYFVRKFLGRSLEVATAFFVVTLAPTLGFIMLYTFRYTFVADHYQYAACIGPLALVAAGLGRGMNRTGQAGRVVQKVVCAGLLIGLGCLSWQQAHAYRDAESVWRDTVLKNPDSWLAHFSLGRILKNQGRLDAALEQYKEVLRINPKDVDSLVNTGNLLFGKGRYDEAMAYYERALEINPANPEAHVNMAVVLAKQGKMDEAIEHDRKAIAGNPKHITALVNLAVMLAGKGDYQQALEYYDSALEVNPDQPMTHINMARALTALGRAEEAQEHYRKAASVVVSHADALAQQGKLEEAAAQFREAIRLIPNNAEAHCHLGMLLARQGRRAEARDEFMQALQINPGYALAREQLQALDRQ
jgi:tetratricopeptide (TPR) repeat protein